MQKREIEPIDDKALERLRAIAIAATPKPWHWEVTPNSHAVALVAENGWGIIVLDTARWGMAGAQLRFNCEDRMVEVKKLVVPLPGRAHHLWIAGIDHPDAIHIEAACPDTILALIERLERAESALTAIREGVD